ncbi:hypothetical protein V7S43_012204 [Phytophthora oleae]|uniref:Uncharacterized protein n=1 Tax=Phytophthora oleae TaxID=2107226 RepID=A0ABD3F8M3_9STRA
MCGPRCFVSEAATGISLNGINYTLGHLGLDVLKLDKYAEYALSEMGTRGVPIEPLRRVVERYYRENARRIWKKTSEHTRRGTVENTEPERKESMVEPVKLSWTVPYRSEAEAIAETEFCLSLEDAAVNYVDVVEPSHRSVTAIPKAGLVEVVSVELPEGFAVSNEDDPDGEMPSLVKKDGRRVVCAVGNFEALSSGYIECLPSRMLADNCATLSLVDSRVLKRLGRSTETLRPYEGTVKSSSGHPLRIRGWIRLCLRLGGEAIELSVLVADQPHVDAILGVDALGAFGAVIDVAERCLTLKDTGEVLPLGFTVVQDA